MKIALISLNQRWEDKEYNLRRCAELAALAATHGAELVVFPEMTLTGFTMNTGLTAEDPATSESVTAFAAIAKQHRVGIIAGVVMRNGEKTANTIVSLDNQGEPQSRYVKIHPFSFAGEDRVFQAGSTLASLTIGGLRFGLTICYDLRFPELYTALANSCEVLVNIANWPKRRIAHWRTLLAARAIENQCYVVGVNRIGLDGNGLEYERSSLVFDANGDEIIPLTVIGELSIHSISREQLLDYRRGFSTRQDRSPDLYRRLI